MTKRLPATTAAPHITTTTPPNKTPGVPLDAAMSRTHLNSSPSVLTYDHTASTAHATTRLWQPVEPRYHGKQTTSRSSKISPPSTTIPPKEPTTRERKFLDNPSTHDTTPYGHHREPRYHAIPKTIASSPPNFETRDTATPPSQLTTKQQQFRLNNPVRNRATARWLPAGPTANPPPELISEEHLTNLENVVKEQRTRLIWYQVKLDRLSTPSITSAALLRRGKHIPADTSPPKNPSPPAPNAESQKATTAAAQPPPIDVNAKLELMTQHFQACLIVAMIIIAVSVYDQAFMSTPHYRALCLFGLHIVFVPNPGGPRGLLGKLCDQLKGLLARVQRYYDPPCAGRGATSKLTHEAATPNGPATPAATATAATPPTSANVDAKLELLTSYFEVSLLTAAPFIAIHFYDPSLVWTIAYAFLVLFWLLGVLVPDPRAQRGIFRRLSDQSKDLVALVGWQGDDI
ncbi:hypothetical protein LTS10_010353 [Elasticomyces elasticus]|nr:hypothetical protein LTS10_010353 [Elasticomyces elasticus]